MTIEAIVSYYPRNDADRRADGSTDKCVVEVFQQADGRYYAKNLSVWGCGRSMETVRGAIAALVQDMAKIVKIDIEGEGTRVVLTGKVGGFQ